MKHSVITISREYGSGGRLIGQKIAEELGLPFYDKKLLTVAAQESGFSEDLLRQAESKDQNSLLYSLATGLGMGYYGPDSLSLYDKLFLAQFDAIRHIAEKGPCVIVGRCADFVLRDRTDCTHFFLHAPIEKRIERAIDSYHIPAEEAPDAVKKTDRARANYYAHYTGHKWGDSRLYHLSADTSRLGVEKTAELLLSYLQLADRR